MKKIIIFSLIFVLFIIPSFASEVTYNSDGSYTVHNAFDFAEDDPQYELSDLSSAFYEAIIRASSDVIDEYTPISDLSISPLWTGDTGSTPIPTGTLRSVLASVIGPYSPVVVQYQYTSGTNTQYLREILPDYEWMFNCALFAMIIWCVFRIWGALLCRR